MGKILRYIVFASSWGDIKSVKDFTLCKYFVVPRLGKHFEDFPIVLLGL